MREMSQILAEQQEGSTERPLNAFLLYRILRNPRPNREVLEAELRSKQPSLGWRGQYLPEES